MRCCTYLILCLVAAGTCAAQTPFADLIKGVQGPLQGGERTVTLDLQRVSTTAAVARLAQGAQLTLRCAPQLAERRVTVLAHEECVADIAEGLARAARGRWRKEGDGFILEPAPMLQVLRPEEVTAELQEALKRAGATATGPSQPAGGIRSLFTAQQAAALEAGHELRAVQLSPQQRNYLTLPLLTRIAAGLELASGLVARVKNPDAVSVTLERRDGGEWLGITTPNGGMLLPLRAGSEQH